MTPTSVKLWLEALRSGLYKQTRGRLADENGYCCLGVACEVYASINPTKLHKTLSGWAETDDGLKRVFMYDGDDAELPDIVREWLGIADSAGRYDATLADATLVHLNDNARLDFPAIADFIKTNLDKLQNLGYDETDTTT